MTNDHGADAPESQDRLTTVEQLQALPALTRIEAVSLGDFAPIFRTATRVTAKFRPNSRNAYGPEGWCLGWQIDGIAFPMRDEQIFDYCQVWRVIK